MTALPFARERRCREDRREEHQVKTIIRRAKLLPEEVSKGVGTLTSPRSVPKEWIKTAVKLEGDNNQVQETHRWFARHLFQL